MRTDFFANKTVLVTGHTGFKGTWLTRLLLKSGAKVIGYSRCSEKDKSLFEMTGMENSIVHIKGDVRNLLQLQEVFEKYKPEIVFHLAAQPLVRESYKDPVYTYETNVLGTLNIMECVRKNNCVKSVVNVTTDKVYLNREWDWGYREDEQLDGFDPYSNSKSCSELITHSYNNSFFNNMAVNVSTVRAGNVIGGGDFAADRIIPDCVRAVMEGKEINVRNPYSIRPYQHVLEPLVVYMKIAEKQYEDSSYQGYYNVGPDDVDCVTTGELVSLFCNAWGDGASWKSEVDVNAPHEAKFLKLDCSKIKKKLSWKPHWHIEDCIKEVVNFSKVLVENGDITAEMDREIDSFLEN